MKKAQYSEIKNFILENSDLGEITDRRTQLFMIHHVMETAAKWKKKIKRDLTLKDFQEFDDAYTGGKISEDELEKLGYYVDQVLK